MASTRKNPAEEHEPVLDPLLEQKHQSLLAAMREKGSVAVAFSGGVDSSLLAKVAHDALGDAAIAVTARMPTFPEREIAQAQAFCRSEGIRQIVFDSRAWKSAAFRANPENRCYLCKKTLLEEIVDVAAQAHAAHVVEGSNVDDESDVRPGIAAIEECGVTSPLRQTGFGKDDIRELARRLGLSMWDKPSFACLATRIPYGTPITPEALARIDAAEQVLIDRGFHHVRVRCCGTSCRIEVAPGEVARLEEALTEKGIGADIEKTGFTSVAVDPRGYVSGGAMRTP